MFEWIAEILQNIGNFFSTVWDFIINFFTEIVYIIKLLASVVANIPSYFTWLPGSVIALIGLAVALVVIYKVVGREG
jgi:phage-related protein